MNNVRRRMIEELAVAHEKARARFESMGLLNVYGRTTEDRENQAKEYAIAEAEMIEAHSKLRGAIGMEDDGRS